MLTPERKQHEQAAASLPEDVSSVGFSSTDCRAQILLRIAGIEKNLILSEADKSILIAHHAERQTPEQLSAQLKMQGSRRSAEDIKITLKTFSANFIRQTEAEAYRQELGTAYQTEHPWPLNPAYQSALESLTTSIALNPLEEVILRSYYADGLPVGQLSDWLETKNLYLGDNAINSIVRDYSRFFPEEAASLPESLLSTSSLPEKPALVKRQKKSGAVLKVDARPVKLKSFDLLAVTRILRDRNLLSGQILEDTGFTIKQHATLIFDEYSSQLRGRIDGGRIDTDMLVAATIMRRGASSETSLHKQFVCSLPNEKMLLGIFEENSLTAQDVAKIIPSLAKAKH